MPYWLSIACLLLLVVAPSCDLRSGTAKKEMEKFSDTPAPAPMPFPTPAASPVDQTDVVAVDTSVVGNTVFVNAYHEKQRASCNKFNDLAINGSGNTVTVKGACRQITINGDGNHVAVDAATGFVFNGTDNSVTYARAVNGNRPTLSQSREGNIVEQVSKQKKAK